MTYSPVTRPRKIAREDQRTQNSLLLLHHLQIQGTLSQAELARMSGLSPATVSEIIQTLLENQWLIHKGKRNQGVGRSSQLLTFNPRKLMTLAVVIDRSEMQIALVDFCARIVAFEQLPIGEPFQPAEIIHELRAAILRLLEQGEIPFAALVGIGIAMPGLIDSEAGIVRVAANLAWKNVPLAELVTQALGLPVYLDHLGQAKVIAESLWGSGHGIENVVCLEIGSGIGAGVIMNGVVLSGSTSAATEVGHNVMDIHGPECTCGLNGCWEIYCNVSAIRKRLTATLTREPDRRSRLTSTASLVELNQAALAGDWAAHAVLDETAAYFHRGLLNVIWNFDPSLIILSGIIVHSCPYLVELIQRKLKDTRTIRDMNVRLMETTLGPHAGLIAASSLISVKHLQHLT